MVAVTMLTPVVRKRWTPEQFEAVISSSMEDGELDGRAVMVLFSEGVSEGVGNIVGSMSSVSVIIGGGGSGWAISVVFEGLLDTGIMLSVFLVAELLTMVEVAMVVALLMVVELLMVVKLLTVVELLTIVEEVEEEVDEELA